MEIDPGSANKTKDGGYVEEDSRSTKKTTKGWGLHGGRPWVSKHTTLNNVDDKILVKPAASTVINYSNKPHSVV